MDMDELDEALHEIQQMIEVSHRAAEGIVGVDEGVSQMPRADHELLYFAIVNLGRRVRATRAMLYDVARPVPVKPALSIVRNPA